MNRRSLCIVVAVVLFTIGEATRAVRVSASGPQVSGAQPSAAQDGSRVRAAGRGWPYVNLRDGVQLPGPGARGAVPFAMASADFDEDGVPDLVAGYGTGQQGFVMIYRGNVDAIHPETDEARQRKATRQFVEAPLLSPADVALPLVPRFLGAGDFDHDGHADIVAAAGGGSALTWLRGNGDGTFGSAQTVALPGPVTGLLAEQMDRPDGSTHIIVSLSGSSTPAILIIDGLTGDSQDQGADALSDSEVIALPAPASSMAVGRLDDDGLIDLAVTAGRELLVLGGRDRDQSDAPRSVARRDLPFLPVAAEIGDFVTDEMGQPDLALLSADGALHLMTSEDPAGTVAWSASADAAGGAREPWHPAADAGSALDASAPLLIRARVASVAGDNAVIVDRARRRIHIVPGHSKKMSVAPATLDVAGDPVAVLPMRLNGDSLSDLVVLAEGADAPVAVMSEPVHTFTVDDPGDAPDCNITDSVCRTGPVDAQGVCQGKCTFRAAITEANVQGGFDAIKFDIGSGTPIITRGPGADWKLTEAAIVDGNSGGATRVELNGTGASNVLVVAGGNSTIRNLVINRGGYGIYLPTNGGNVLEGNFIGTDATGTAAASNSGYGIEVVTPSNTIGGTTPAARNIISANGLDGIYVSGAAGNAILGNYVGTDVTGNVALGNAGNGISLISAPNSQVGGAAVGAGNVISANIGGGPLQGGVVALGTTSGSVIQGNFIGTTASGTAALGNAGPGINVRTGSGHMIGGTTATARNVIAGNGSHGVVLAASGISMQAAVQGNRIGTDINGQVDLGNAGHGIVIQGSHDSTIGGTVTGSPNLISGNGLDGVHIEFAGAKPANNKVLGNLIGTTANGTGALGNAGDGIELANATNTTIGGTSSAARNVIAANGGRGLYVNSSSSLIQGNVIGSDPSGKSSVIGNAGDGIFVESFQTGNTIGGTANGSGNTIAFNAGMGIGIAASSATGHQIRRNVIFGNSKLGIDLGADGVTANDPCDGDAGANLRQNFPVLTSVDGTSTVRGTLNSAPNTTFSLDFFISPSADASGYGEGQAFLGSATVTTDGSCAAAFSATFSKTTIPAGQFITATATDPGGNTSEFSQAMVVPGSVTVTSPNTGVNWGIGTTQTITWDHNLGLGTPVKVEISRDGGTSWSVIAPSVKSKATSGTLKWVVTGPSTTQARIRVTSTTDATVSDVSDVNFTIANPFVTVIKPNASADVWTAGSKQTITWDSNLGSLEKVRIDLSTDGGVTYPVTILSSTPSDGKQAVVVQSSWVSSSARVRVTWLKDASVADASDASFRIQ